MLSYILAISCLKVILTNSATGKATYYGGNEYGNACGFAGVDKATFPFGDYAATGSANFNKGYGCGTCFEVTCLGPYGTNPSCKCSDTPTVTVQTLDQCSECSISHFDLNENTMKKIVGPGLAGTCGVISISYKEVPCKYEKSFTVRNKGGTSQWWYGMHLDNLAGPGAAIEVDLLKNGKKVGECNKGQGPSFWICSPSNGAYPALPMDIKLYGDEGETVTGTNCITSWQEGVSMNCNGNFGASNGGGGTDTPTTTTTTTTTERGGNNGGNNGGNSGTIVTIKNKPELNEWWYAVLVSTNNDIKIKKVFVKADGMASWEEGTFECTWYDEVSGECVNFYYYFVVNKPYSPPFAFKIKLSDGKILIRNNVIDTLNVNDASAKSQGQLTENDTFLVENDGENNKGSWAVWFAVCVIILIVIALILIGVFCVMKKKKQKIEVGFDDKYADDVMDNNTKQELDENENENEEEQQEIEVDVQLTTTEQ